MDITLALNGRTWTVDADIAAELIRDRDDTGTATCSLPDGTPLEVRRAGCDASNLVEIRRDGALLGWAPEDEEKFDARWTRLQVRGDPVLVAWMPPDWRPAPDSVWLPGNAKKSVALREDITESSWFRVLRPAVMEDVNQYGLYPAGGYDDDNDEP